MSGLNDPSHPSDPYPQDTSTDPGTDQTSPTQNPDSKKARTANAGVEPRTLPTGNRLTAMSPSAPSTSEIRKARRRAERTRTLSACKTCKESRAKCSDTLPCPRCIRLGMARICAGAGWEDQNSNEQARPMQTANFSALNSTSPPLIFTPDSVLDNFVKRLQMHGFQRSYVSSIFSSMTIDLRAAVELALRSQPELDLAGSSHDVSSGISSSSTQHEDDLGEDFWATAEYCGYCRATFDPTTSAQTNLFLNTAFCSFTGLEQPELLSRIQNHGLPISNELDWFCAVMDDFLRRGEARSTRYVRIPPALTSPVAAKPSLVTWTTVRLFDSSGRITEVKHWITGVSHEEYDDVLRRNPHMCRPFAAAMDDLRTAEQCIADYGRDRSMTMALLASMEDGRRRLDLLARAIQQRLGQ